MAAVAVPVQKKQSAAKSLFQGPVETDGDGKDLVFSFALFVAEGGLSRNFPWYYEACVRFLQAIVKQWPKCKLVGHLGPLVPPRAIKGLKEAGFNAKGQQRCEFIRYMVSPVNPKDRRPLKPGTCWVINSMRYRTLWEYQGKSTVVVCDVHDDPVMMKRILSRVLRKLSTNKQEICHTYWRSSESDCLNDSGLPLRGRGHCHTDGGLTVWRSGKARRMARKGGKFVGHVGRVLDGVREVPRGIDEMLVDCFLRDAHVFTRDIAMFERHKHRIRFATKLTDAHKTICDLSQKRPKHMSGLKQVKLDLGGSGPSIVYVCSEERTDQVQRAKLHHAFIKEHDDVCHNCESGGVLLCCDSCTAAYHLKCLRPALKEVPSGFWECIDCVQETKENGAPQAPPRPTAEEEVKSPKPTSATKTPKSAKPRSKRASTKPSSAKASSASNRRTNAQRTPANRKPPSSVTTKTKTVAKRSKSSPSRRSVKKAQRSPQTPAKRCRSPSRPKTRAKRGKLYKSPTRAVRRTPRALRAQRRGHNQSTAKRRRSPRLRVSKRRAYA